MHQEIDVAGTVDALQQAKSVVIVPGYGLAVANAQVGWLGEDAAVMCSPPARCPTHM